MLEVKEVSLTSFTFSFLTMPLLLILFILLASGAASQAQEAVHIRSNLVGCLPEEQKTAIAFSDASLKGNFRLLDASGKTVFKGPIKPAPAPGFDSDKYYWLDFTAVTKTGSYQLQVGKTTTQVVIGPSVYGRYHEDLLYFMRQQRCGYNPFFDVTCHEKDGRAMDGPMMTLPMWMRVVAGTMQAINSSI